MWATFVISLELHKVNNRPMGANWPNLVTLHGRNHPQPSVYLCTLSAYKWHFWVKVKSSGKCHSLPCEHFKPFQAAKKTVSDSRKFRPKNVQGSMLWSHFSAIFVTSRQKNGVFSFKNQCYGLLLAKTNSSLSKNDIFFSKIFRQKYFKNQNTNLEDRCLIGRGRWGAGWPDLGTFSLIWAIFLFSAVFIENYRSSPYFCTTFFYGKNVMHKFWHKNGLGCILGDIFTSSSGQPGWGVGRIAQSTQKVNRSNLRRSRCCQ
jgi:hypothetical protein